MLLGFLEFIPAILLLFRKTKLLGAILLLPSLIAVVLVNNAYGFLPHMRILTAVLLLMNIILLFPGRAVIVAFLKGTIGTSKFSLREVIFNMLVVALVITLIVVNFI